MTRHARILLVGAICLLGGCFDVTDEITWNPDGTARLKRTIRLAAATPEAATARAEAINKEAEYASIQINNKVGGVKSFELQAAADGANVVVTEDLTVADASSLTAVQLEASKQIKVDGQTFEWTPPYAFDKLPNGRVQFRAGLDQVKVPASFERSTAKTVFGDKQFVLRLRGPSIASAAPTGAANGANYVEWRASLADIAGGEVKDPELVAEIATSPASGLATVGIAVVVVFLVAVLAVALRKPPAAQMRPPAPRIMPTVLDSGPVERVASDEAMLSDASEINVDAEEDVPMGAAAAAQAAAGGVVKFKCPKCQVELKVPLHLAGQRGKCRKCGGAFVSPVPATLKKQRAAVEAQPAEESASLRDAFSVKKVKCSCGVTSAVLKGRAAEGEERCPACNQVLVLT